MSYQIDQYITFEIETWVGDEMIMVQKRAKILDFCKDPLKRHEDKCSVEINGEGYGIPISKVLKVDPLYGEQLALF